MAKNLLIVESPAKVRTIKKFLGKDFDIRASMGHIKDLPEKELGVEIEKGFVPRYTIIPEKKKILQELKKAAKNCETIYLAPDPDREGEAIAWHIADEIDKDRERTVRATFNEITEQAVLNAIRNPRKLDQNLFNAQQARRILDRLVGYKLSPLLWRKVRWGLSAGRVQSVALRLICEREKAINEFVPEEYWTIEVLFEKSGEKFWAKLVKFREKKLEIRTGEEAERISKELKRAEFVVENVEQREKKKNPPPPFITSSLQQDASRRLGFSPAKTMLIAQRLYEGVNINEEGNVALITYMRTDSFRVSETATEATRRYIKEKYGDDYIPATPPKFKSRKTAQEAHEAIRPTSMEYPPERVKSALKKDEYRLYELIWKRFLASQMTSAVYDQTDIEIKGSDYTLRVSGSILKFPGFLTLYTEIKEKNEKEEEVHLPDLKKGEKLTLKDLKQEQHFTQPPSRYTEATLVRELEDKGIGRPSTYASIVSTIQERKYVEKKKNKLYPTCLGSKINDLLVQNFPEVIDIQFTAKMEENLDKIEEGKQNWVELLKDFYASFDKALKAASENMTSIKSEGIPTDINCEKCGGKMIIKLGKKGEFLACSNYPDCKNTKNFSTGENGEIIVVEDEQTEIKCDLCGRPMIRRKGPYGFYLACSGYPFCRNTTSINVNSKPVPTGVKCPACEGELLERKGRRGTVFFGCSNYPRCKFTLKHRPVSEVCPKCGSPFLLKKDANTLSCPTDDCGYTMSAG